MPEPSQRNQSDLLSLPSGDAVYFCLSVWALPLELLLHRNFGRRFIDWTALLAAIWPFIFAKLVAPDVDPSWAMWTFWIVLILAAMHKGRAIELERRGPVCHSAYCGEPWLGQLLRIDEISWKVLWEPLACIAAGLALMNVEYSLGYFLAGSGVALRTKNWLRDHHAREALADLNDAYIDQQVLAERFRRRV